MHTAFVGQRVRIKWLRTPQWEKLAGTEATITAVAEFPASEDHPLPGHCRAACDMAGGVEGQFLFEQLEPILPEGAAPSEHTAEELFEKLGINVTEGEKV